MAPRRSGKGVKDALVKASEMIKKVAETKLLSDLARATGNPVAGKILDNLGAGKKRRAPRVPRARKGAGFFGDFLGLGKKKKAPARPRAPKQGGWGWIKKLIKAPIQIVTPALAGGIGGVGGGIEAGIDNVGNGRRRRRGGMKMVPSYAPASQLTR